MSAVREAEPTTKGRARRWRVRGYLHRFPVRRLRILSAILAVALACVTGAVVVLAVELYGIDRTEQAVTEARQLARSGAEQLLTYDASSLEQDLERSRALVAPGFEAEFEQLVTSLIAPATRQGSLRTVATVERDAVVDAEADQVEVLVFLRQETTRPGQEPSTASSRAVVTMVREAGRWLVGGLRPV